MNTICVPLETAGCICGETFRRIPAVDLAPGVPLAIRCPACLKMQPPNVEEPPLIRLTTAEIADGLYRFGRIEHEGHALLVFYLGNRDPQRLFSFPRDGVYYAEICEMKPSVVFGAVRYYGKGETPALALADATKRAYLFLP